MLLKSALFASLLVALVSADGIREIQVVTADCNDCGMTTLGQLSAKICGQGDSNSNFGRCCVAHKMASNQDNYVEGEIDVFAGPDSLAECYNFDLGTVVADTDMSITLYHSGTDGGVFDKVTVITNENHSFKCDFGMFLDGSTFAQGTACTYN